MKQFYFIIKVCYLFLTNLVGVTKFVRWLLSVCYMMILYVTRPREDAGGLGREYILRISSVSQKATKGAPLYSHMLIRRKTITLPNLT